LHLVLSAATFFFADKTTLACAGAIRKSSPVIVGSLVVMVTVLAPTQPPILGGTAAWW